MKVEYFIVKRLVGTKEGENRLSRPIVRIAVLAIALSVAVMLIAVAVVKGFKKDISDKVIGFGSHIQISSFSFNNSLETSPIFKHHDYYTIPDQEEGIAYIQSFATKAGIIKTHSEIHGVVFKGMGSDFHTDFFEQNLIEGKVPVFQDSIVSNEVLISKKIAQQLQLQLGQNLVMYFVQNPPRVRKFRIAGIYSTELEELDELFVIGDIQHIQKLNGWPADSVGGFELGIDNIDDLEQKTERVYHLVGYDLNVKNIKQLYPQIFDWLQLLDVNVSVIIFLMLVVAIINMITALLILILERTKLIGILKALGQTNWSIRKVFLLHATYLVFRGVIFGNLLGLLLSFLQSYFHIIHLDSSIYYMSTVPIYLTLSDVLLINIGTIFVSFVVLIIPTIFITNITPVKAIRFE